MHRGVKTQKYGDANKNFKADGGDENGLKHASKSRAGVHTEAV